MTNSYFALWIDFCWLCVSVIAVPLVSVEPHFSVWSAADRLTDAATTHWSGTPQPISILLTADGVKYRLCGRSPMNVSPLPQTSVRVRATETVCEFAKDGLSATVSFLTPRTDDVTLWEVHLRRTTAGGGR